MAITPKHREVEARFRRLLVDASLAQPDEVQYEPVSVVFLWHEPKAAVIVDFDEVGPPDCPFAR